MDFNTRFEKPPSQAVLEARGRRLARAHQVTARTEFFLDEIIGKVHTTLMQRVRIATEYAKSKVVINISRPVTKTYVTRVVQVVGKNGKTRNKKESEVHISDRSVAGEFPKADTTQLMKTILGHASEIAPGVFAGYIGTPLDYGVVLELRRNRSFLLRTLNEERSTIMRILTGPIS